MIDRQEILKISGGVVSQEIDGETVLLDMDGENYFGLNEVGTRVWQLLHEPCDLEKIFSVIVDEYDVERDELKKDLDDIIDQLLTAGLVTVQPPGSDD